MHEYERIFCDIRVFIIDYVTLVEKIEENHGSMMGIKLDKEVFYLPATLNEYSQRAKEFEDGLQRQMRILAQQRRHEIVRGIESDEKQILNDNQYRFDERFKTRLEKMQKNTSDKNIHRIQVMINALELFDDPSFSKITFRLLPIVNHIQNQLCCISSNIQQTLDNHHLIIEQHLRKLREKLNRYDQSMRKKLSEYISRDIRPPMLVIPCPTNPNNEAVALHPHD